MVKIAVTLSGLVRYWDVTSKIFEHWNNLYDNIEFTFFLTTWKNNKVWFDEAKVKDGILEENDYSKYKFLAAYSKIDHEAVENIVKEFPGPSVLYAYALQGVHELRRKYQNDNNVEFFGVIQTRNDIFIPRHTLDLVTDLCIKNKIVAPELFFTPTGTAINVGKTKQNRFILRNDNFSFSHPLAMDKFAEMFHDCYITGENERRALHFMQAEQLMNKKIYNYRMDGKNPTPLIRVDSLKKDGWPTDDQLKQIIETKGVEFLYDNDLETLKKYFTQKND